MTSQNPATKLNPVQLHLLDLFSKNMKEEDLIEIKKLLVQYYKEKVEQEVNAFWKANSIDKAKWNKITRDIHSRSKKVSTK